MVTGDRDRGVRRGHRARHPARTSPGAGRGEGRGRLRRPRARTGRLDDAVVRGLRRGLRRVRRRPRRAAARGRGGCHRGVHRPHDLAARRLRAGRGRGRRRRAGSLRPDGPGLPRCRHRPRGDLLLGLGRAGRDHPPHVRVRGRSLRRGHARRRPRRGSTSTPSTRSSTPRRPAPGCSRSPTRPPRRSTAGSSTSRSRCSPARRSWRRRDPRPRRTTPVRARTSAVPVAPGSRRSGRPASAPGGCCRCGTTRPCPATTCRSATRSCSATGSPGSSG